MICEADTLSKEKHVINFLNDNLMLELQKFVLQRVCDDAVLFKKELIKSLKWLSSPDIEQLKQWVWLEFGKIHGDVISEVIGV